MTYRHQVGQQLTSSVKFEGRNRPVTLAAEGLQEYTRLIWHLLANSTENSSTYIEVPADGNMIAIRQIYSSLGSSLSYLLLT
jgi:hypothetical protein